MKIFTVGIGSRSGELIPEYDEQGKVTGYVKDADGKYVTSRLAEETLVEIAQRTGGEVFHADAKRFGVDDVARALAGAEAHRERGARRCSSTTRSSSRCCSRSCWRCARRSCIERAAAARAPEVPS